MSQSHLSFLVPNPAASEIVILTAGSHTTAPGHRVGAQIVDYCLIHHIVEGQGVFRCRDRSYPLRAGSSFFIFPDELVAYESDKIEPWRYFWVGFRSAAACRLLQSAGLTAESPIANLTGSLRVPALLRRIERHFQEHSPFSELQSEAYIRLLLAEYGKSQQLALPQSSSGTNSSSIDKAIRWMNAHCHEPISIERLASIVGYHRSHLTKLFHKHTGCSPMAYLLQLRMQKALSLLHGQLSIEQVANATGYADPLYFSKQFKKWVGQSPSEYRQSR